jgi:hypothetical protein
MTAQLTPITEVEQIAATQPSDYGRELRDAVAGMLGCKADELHPDPVRRADA